MAASTKLLLVDVVNALERLTNEQTKELVVRFGVQLHLVVDIESQCRASNPKLHIFQAWLDRDTEASWEKIVAGLKQIGMDVLAKEVASRHCPLSFGAGIISAVPDNEATVPIAQPVSTPAPVSSSAVATTSAVVSQQPLSPANVRLQPVALSTPSVANIKATIFRLERLFSNLVSSTRSAMCEKESRDESFLDEFRDHLFNLPVAKKATHVKFFREIEDDILEAKNIRKVFVILSRYWSYRNYEILADIINWFCDTPLQKSMQEYCSMLEGFEMTTTVDVYIIAVSACKKLELAFSEMVMKIAKPPSKCTLYEIRKLKEEIAGASSLSSHSVYIDSEAVQCVVVVLRFPNSAVGWVLAGMTTDFMCRLLLTGITVDGEHLTVVQETMEVLVCLFSVCGCLFPTNPTFSL